MIFLDFLGFLFVLFAFIFLILGVILVVCSLIGKNFSLEMTGTGIIATVIGILMVVWIFHN